MCGAEVRQRFGARPPRRGSPPPSVTSWRGAEETIIMPVVPVTAPASRRRPRKAAVSEAPPPKPAAARRPRPEAVAKPFFTEVVPAVSNRQHRRLWFIVPVLLLVFCLLLGFALFVLPYL